MRWLVAMDPVSSILIEEDTTFALMREAHRRGHELFHCLLRDLELHEDRLVARCRRAEPQEDVQEPLRLHPPRREPVDTFDVVLVRKDPPFDPPYLWATLLLEQVRGRTLVVNDPRGLREANEKLYAMRFPDLTPQTLVAADKAAIGDFVDRVGGRAVVKPVDGHGGGGIFVLDRSDPNFRAILESATRDGDRPVIVQRFLPEVARGDKRILLLDGEPLGAILRIPRPGEARSNIHVGGRVEPCSLEEADRRIVERLAPSLRADGLWFVGIDVIGGRLTEVNVTSPTGIQQASRFAGVRLEARVVDWIEARADQGALTGSRRA